MTVGEQDAIFGLMSATPKDHYVPQCYLDAFAIEGPGKKEPHIYQYMPDGIVSARIKDVASEKHFYTFPHKKTGAPMREVDELLTHIEGLASPVIKKIIQEGELNLSEEEHKNLAIFISMLVIRTPGFIKSQESVEEEGTKEFMAIKALNKEKFHKDWKEMAEDSLSEEDIEKQRQIIINKKYSIEFPNSKGHFMARGVKTAERLANYYYYLKKLHLLYSDSEQVLITSDNPVSVYRPVYVPPAMNAGYANGTLLVPIGPCFALLLRDKSLGKNKIKLSGERIKLVNKNIIHFSDNYVFSNLKSKKIFEVYKNEGGKHFQKTKTTRMKSGPYTFFTSGPVPKEFIF